MQLLDGISPLQLHQLMTITGFHPADSEIGNEKPHHMGFTQIRHEGSAMVVPFVTADVAGGHMSLIPQALGEGLEAQHQIVDEIAVLLSKAWKQGRPPGLLSTIL